MKKRISLKEWTYIGKYNHAKKAFQPWCSYFLTKIDEDTFVRSQYLCLPLYALLTIPLHILQAFCLMWDGGLREFEFVGRFMGRDTFHRGNPPWEKVVEVWENHK